VGKRGLFSVDQDYTRLARFLLLFPSLSNHSNIRNTANILCVQLHQLMVAEEELRALQVMREKQRENLPNEKSACLIAVLSAASIRECPEDLMVDQGEAVVGTLDLHAVRALPGEVLIGTPNFSFSFERRAKGGPCIGLSGIVFVSVGVVSMDVSVEEVHAVLNLHII
jgi:hypothetical protein